jgi:hypothetical protein
MEKYRKYEPESWQAKMMLAILLRRVKRYDEALKYYKYVCIRAMVLAIVLSLLLMLLQ